MYVKEVILDGFKSYAHRTVVENFDPSFNAITGLNGSGKSNILDAICFVLGISVLSQVRVTSLQELIYKQGQAGVTKASVTIVFNNEDKKEGQCPVGYDQYPEITVTRQIVMGGKNKYLINGKLAQHKTVQDLFQSVQLNVNNPHFLIMQGRITKVLNMKPPEILGLMEEAAGTRMFEMKKLQARKTIEKKDKKLEEINNIMDNEISPKLTRLQKQRDDYNTWVQTKVAVEGLQRYVTAYTYVSNQEQAKKKSEEVAKTKAEAEACKEDIQAVQVDQQRLQQEIQKMKEKLAKNKSNSSTVELEKQELQVSKDVVRANSALEYKEKELEAEKSKIVDMAKAKDELAKAIKAKEEEKVKAEKVLETTMEKAWKIKQQLKNAQNQLQLLKSGVAAGEDGQSLTEQLMGLNQKCTQAKTDIKSHELRIKHLQKSLKDAQAAASQTDAQYTACKTQLEAAEKEMHALQKKLGSLDYDADAMASCQQELDTVRRQARDLQQQVTSTEDRLSQLKFDYTDPHDGFDRSKVKGLVAKLIQVHDKNHSTAVEVTAGGRLYNVVVSDEKTGSAILKSGNLRRKVTFIPLNQIQSKTIDQRVQQKARTVSGGQADLALQLVGYDVEVKAAMQYVFGSTFVCPDGDSASAVAYHREVNCRTVTLGGDEYSPAGTMTGGAKGNLGNTLIALQGLNERREELAAVQAKLAELTQFIQGSAAARDEYQRLKQKLAIKEAEVEQLKQRMEHSEQHQSQVGAQKMAEDIQSLTDAVKERKAFVVETEQKIKAIEAEVNEFQGGKEKEQKVENEIAKLKKQLETTQPQLAQKEKAVHTLVAELDDLVGEDQDDEKSKQEKVAAMEQILVEIQQLKGVLEAKQAEHKAAKEKLEEAHARLRQESELLNQKQEDEEHCTQREQELNRKLKGLDHLSRQLEGQIKAYKHSTEDLIKNNPWINQTVNGQPRYMQFGVAGGEFDFSSRSPHEAKAELERMEEEQKGRSKVVNKRAVEMFDDVQKEFSELQEKKHQVSKDKGMIESVIDQLDQEKKTQLKQTHEKVNKDFGSIFGTLLGGACAELVAVSEPDGSLTGLEVRVGFNGTWKEGLSELSGGQRSLLALSLILALLLFKPAPMYILDEVDAALDLSHTQNIGKMLKQHFNNSQFIVVSLKEGMFNNANVVFRTRFNQGQSQVIRTVN